MKPEIPSSDSAPLSPPSPVGVTGHDVTELVGQISEPTQMPGGGETAGGDAGGKNPTAAGFNNEPSPGTNMRTREQWLEMMVMGMNAVTYRDLKEAELRTVWLVLWESYRAGRMATAKMTERMVAAQTGIGVRAAHYALTHLRRMGIIQPNTDGDGWQFMPAAGLRDWLCPLRSEDGSKQRPAGGHCAAQRAPCDQRDTRPEDTVSLDKANAGVAVGYASDPLFLPSGASKLEASSPCRPSKSSSPPQPHMAPLQTINAKGDPASKLEANPESGPVEDNGTEAGMKKEPDVNDGWATDRATLIKRLEHHTGLDGSEGMKKWGPGWSNRIAVCPTAVRDAINDTNTAEREGKIKTTWFRYCWARACELAGWQGWVYDKSSKKWVQMGKKVNIYEHRNAARKDKR
ncbi:MAG: hypothetical protein WA117_01955 [Verrucomicrobiia bacterium]